MWSEHTYFYTFNQTCLATVIMNMQVSERVQQAQVVELASLAQLFVTV